MVRKRCRSSIECKFSPALSFMRAYLTVIVSDKGKREPRRRGVLICRRRGIIIGRPARPRAAGESFSDAKEATLLGGDFYSCENMNRIDLLNICCGRSHITGCSRRPTISRAPFGVRPPSRAELLFMSCNRITSLFVSLGIRRGRASGWRRVGRAVLHT